jgi:effector-binding domain-containing protein
MIGLALTHHCEMKEFPAQLVVSIRLRTPLAELPERIGQTYGQIAAFLAEHQAVPAGDPFVAYYNMDMDDLEIEAGLPVAHKLPSQGDLQCRELPGGPAVVCLHTGPYTELGTAYDSLNQWLQHHNFQGTGVTYEFYRNDPTVTAPKLLQTEVIMPIKDA